MFGADVDVDVDVDIWDDERDDDVRGEFFVFFADAFSSYALSVFFSFVGDLRIYYRAGRRPQNWVVRPRQAHRREHHLSYTVAQRARVC